MKIAYTGHRNIQVTERIRALLMEDLINPAVDEVIVGGAQGFDLFVGKLARETGKPFTLILPYPVEIIAKKWGKADKAELAAQVKTAKEVIIIEKDYSRDALFTRNREMVERADVVVACWDGREKGGTYHCLRYALSQDKPVYNIYYGKVERVYPERTSADIFSQDEEEGQYRLDHLVSSLERIIYEECDYIEGKVVAAHENITDLPYYLTAEYLARKMNISCSQAEELRDYFLVFDPTLEMIETFITWVKQKGYDPARRWFSCMAIELVVAGGVSSEDALERSRYMDDSEEFETYTYHILDEKDEDYELTWEERQPHWYRQLLAKIDKCQDLEELSVLGKSVYSGKLSQDQAGVFWTQYDIKKSKLEEAIPLSTTARAFLKKIAQANGNLARVGAWLYRVQKGEVKVANPINNQEWTVIWKAYNQAKASIAAVATI